MISRDAEARKQATLAGSAPPTLSKAPPVLVEMPKPATQLQEFFTLQPGMWTDYDGIKRTAQRHTIVGLSEKVAAVARNTEPPGICLPDDPRAAALKKKLRKFGPLTQQPPELWHCWNWDSGEAPVNDPNLVAHISTTGSRKTVFEPLDRGPAYSMAVRVTPAVASRSGDEND
jgi:hypothetical protein